MIQGYVCRVEVVAVVYFDVDVTTVGLNRNDYRWCGFVFSCSNKVASVSFTRQGACIGLWTGNVWGDGDEVV